MAPVSAMKTLKKVPLGYVFQSLFQRLNQGHAQNQGHAVQKAINGIQKQQNAKLWLLASVL